MQTGGTMGMIKVYGKARFTKPGDSLETVKRVHLTTLHGIEEDCAREVFEAWVKQNTSTHVATNDASIAFDMYAREDNFREAFEMRYIGDSFML